MPTFKGMSYTEYNESGEMTLNLNGEGSGTRMFDVDWTDRLTFQRALLGYNSQGDGPNQYRQPATFPGNPFMVCTRTSSKGLGTTSTDSNDMIAFPKARITAYYEIPNVLTAVPGGVNVPGTFGNNLWLAESMEIGAEFLELPEGHFAFADGTTIDDQPLVKLVGNTRIALTIQLQYAVNKTTVQLYRGKINASAWRGFAAETLLFMGVSTELSIDRRNKSSRGISFIFVERDQSWNKVYRPGTDQWEVVAPLPYVTANFDGPPALLP